MPDRIRTAIFGGTFNPIHNGHLAVARSVLDAGLADGLWLMVTPMNPWKRDQKLTDDDYRLNLARLATHDMDGITASDFEFNLPKPSYTANTLRALSEAFPDRDFILVIGADNWEKFANWYDSRFILDNYSIIVYPRSGYSIENSTGADVHILDCPLWDVSSTQIRERLSQGKPVEGMVPDCILSSLGLYQTDGIR